jgi:hypothetical protein
MKNEFSQEFVSIECCNCGVVFAVSTHLDKQWHKEKKIFYCPNGHGQSYTRSTAEFLQEKLDARDSEIRALKHELYLAGRKRQPKKRTKRA